MLGENLVHKPEQISIYIHWPFCSQKCPYCDFNSYVPSGKVLAANWAQAYLNQLKCYAPQLRGKRLRSIFFGGGTPSLMSPTTVESIIQALAKYTKVEKDLEITLEGNPSTFELKKFQDFAQAGVNRLSLGVQSFDEAALKFLGRNHSSEQAIRAIDEAQRCFQRVTFDLINGLPGQTLQDWHDQLKQAVAFKTSHLSIYELTIEPATPFHKQGVQAVPEEVGRAMYDLTQEVLAKAGYRAYEISNYAKGEDERSQHNLQYWEGGLYLGIGPGAHSRLLENGKLMASLGYKSPKKWQTKALNLSLPLDLQKAEQECSEVSKEERILELMIVSFRVVDRPIYRELLQHFSGSAVQELVRAGMLEELSASACEGLPDIFSNLKVSYEGRLQLDALMGILARSIVS